MNTTEYKDEIFEKLIQDDDLAKSLINKDNSFLTNCPSVPQRKLLRDKNILTYFNLDEIQDSAESYVFMKFYFDFDNTGMLASVTITFNTFVHVDLQKTDEGVLRSDFINDRIEEILNNKGDLIRVKRRDLDSYKKYITNETIFRTITGG